MEGDPVMFSSGLTDPGHREPVSQVQELSHVHPLTLTPFNTCVAVLGGSSTGRETVSTIQTAQSCQRWPHPGVGLSEAGLAAQSSTRLPTTDRQCST